MEITDYAGILGLVTAALLAAWMLIGASPTSPHRGDPRHSTPDADARPPRHRATSGGRLHRLFR